MGQFAGVWRVGSRYGSPVSRPRRTWRPSRVLRFVVVAWLLVLAGALALLAYGALSNLWAAYRDSPVTTYLAIGLPALVGCLAALFAAVHVWRDG